MPTPHTYQVRSEDLTPHKLIVVTGSIGWARVRSLMGPEDIQRVNQIRSSKFPLDPHKPITQFTLHNASVMYADPNNPTVEERYVAERLYTSQTYPERGHQFSQDNKGEFLPPLLQRMPDGSARQISDDEIPASQRALPTEPAPGQRATAVLRVFDSSWGKNGLTLAAIILEDEPQWFTGGTTSNLDSDELAARGIVFSGPLTNQTGQVYNDTEALQTQPQQSQTPQTQLQQQNYQQPQVNQATGYAMPTPQTQGINPAATQPQQPQQPQVTNPVAQEVLNAVGAQQNSGASAFGTTPQQSASPNPAPVTSEQPTQGTVRSPWSL